MKKTILIPKFLHEIHGEKALLIDVLLTHIFAILVTSLVISLSWNSELSWFKLIILGILTYDLSGGVLANFSRGTSDHYASNAKARINFLRLHLLQPTLMIYIFQGTDLVLAAMGVYILFSSFLVNSQKDVQKQLLLGTFFSLVGICFLFVPGVNLSSTEQLLLTFFLLKLPLAFAVQWYRLGK